jgi:hypothetical protein
MKPTSSSISVRLSPEIREESFVFSFHSLHPLHRCSFLSVFPVAVGCDKEAVMTTGFLADRSSLLQSAACFMLVFVYSFVIKSLCD